MNDFRTLRLFAQGEHMGRFSLLALIAVLAAGPVLAQQAVEPPSVRPGSRWVYKSADGRRTLGVDSVAGDGTITATIDTPGLAGLEVRFTKEWNPVMAPIAMMGTIRFQRYTPPVCLMPQAPWTVGKEWACDAAWTDGTYSGTTHVTGKIEAAEKITVTAGMFDSLRVKTNVGGTETSCWYAPQIEQYALCKSGNADYNYELVSYRLP
jgi:hypothetical protein